MNNCEKKGNENIKKKKKKKKKITKAQKQKGRNKTDRRPYLKSNRERGDSLEQMRSSKNGASSTMKSKAYPVILKQINYARPALGHLVFLSA